MALRRETVQNCYFKSLHDFEYPLRPNKLHFEIEFVITNVSFTFEVKKLLENSSICDNVVLENLMLEG